MSVRSLSPQVVWNHFEDINAIPRASKKEEAIIEYMIQFGEKNGFETIKDKIGNVIIKKPATTGMEDRQTVVMQSHLDMVHQKNNDTDFDFATQGINSLIDGDWVTANGTTLGADNGMGVAAIMSVLVSTDIAHPAIEALFTIDEETGMTGAKELEEGILEGTILLNLDTEDDDELCIGCAGGIDANISKQLNYEQAPEGNSFQITVKGLKGGHSGMDIHLGRGNANKIMNRILYSVQDKIRVASIDGGSLRNAIPRESVANIVLTDIKLKKSIETIISELKHEFRTSEPLLFIEISEIDPINEVVCLSEQTSILNLTYSIFNGVYRMSPEFDGLVEASSSLARVLVNKDRGLIMQCLIRSSVESSKLDLSNVIRTSVESNGSSIEFDGDYPGWAPQSDSKILGKMERLYQSIFNEAPNVIACHAGLECGIIGSHYPQLDMISFGPTIKNPHSPDEKVKISSVGKFWTFLLETLKNTPIK